MGTKHSPRLRALGPSLHSSRCTVWLWLTEDGKKTTDHFDILMSPKHVQETLEAAFRDKTVASFDNLNINMGNLHLTAWEVKTVWEVKEIKDEPGSGE